MEFKISLSVKYMVLATTKEKKTQKKHPYEIDLYVKHIDLFKT